MANAPPDKPSTTPSGRLDTADLLLEWTAVPWDSALFGAPVLRIDRLEIRGPAADQAVAAFATTRDDLAAGLVSCRLSHERLRESMLLEAHGFRFIEMLFQPELAELSSPMASHVPLLTAMPATHADLPAILEIAGSAFRNERFHVDPRIDPSLGDTRYRNWAVSAFAHPHQRLHALRDGSRLVAFFVTELLADATCFWHLNAVAPGAHGQGYGKRAWLTMLHHARNEGAERVRTSIVARNHRVLNLYARLGFRFPPPLMTFHWVRRS